jgi:hypothetical protein
MRNLTLQKQALSVNSVDIIFLAIKTWPSKSTLEYELNVSIFFTKLRYYRVNQQPKLEIGQT